MGYMPILHGVTKKQNLEECAVIQKMDTTRLGGNKKEVRGRWREKEWTMMKKAAEDKHRIQCKKKKKNPKK